MAVFSGSRTTGIAEYVLGRVGRATGESVGQTRRPSADTDESWWANNGGSVDPPASAVEVGSQRSSFRCDHITKSLGAGAPLRRSHFKLRTAGGLVQCRTSGAENGRPSACSYALRRATTMVPTWPPRTRTERASRYS